MEKDPFGNLTDWGPVLDLLNELSENGTISKCQPGLIRILRYKGNWRLREEALKRVNKVENPCDELVLQISSLLADDNLYYDARILAGNALVQLSQNAENGFPIELKNFKVRPTRLFLNMQWKRFTQMSSNRKCLKIKKVPLHGKGAKSEKYSF